MAKKRLSPKPRKPMGPYMFYCQEQSKRIKKIYPGAPNYRQLLTATWTTLPPLEKERYLHKAELDRRRYYRELHQFKKQEKPRRKNPAKAINGWNYYRMAHLREVKARHPHVKAQQQLMKVIAKMWKETSEPVRRCYTLQAVADRISRDRYYRESKK